MLISAEQINVNNQLIQGTSALHSACKKGYTDIIEMLLAKDADINIRNNSGKTPLDMARKYNHEDIVELLQSRGATSGGKRRKTMKRKKRIIRTAKQFR